MQCLYWDVPAGGMGGQEDARALHEVRRARVFLAPLYRKDGVLDNQSNLELLATCTCLHTPSTDGNGAK